MKNLLLIFLSIIIFSCTQEKTELTKAQGIIPSDVGLLDIVLDQENNTWKDLDFYYKNEVLKNHQSTDYFDNLRNVIFTHLVNDFQMLDNAAIETIEFYANEQISINFINEPMTFILTLEKLKNTWGEEKVKEVAQARFDKNIDYINNNFSNPNDALSHFGYELRHLSNYANTAHNK